MQHTERTHTCTQNAHNMHTHKHRQTYMQHIQEEREQHTEQNTENSTHISPAQDNAQPQRTFIHTYSLDLYHEYVAIKNSDTIELYTILND